eukprot:gene3-503_t
MSCCSKPGPEGTPEVGSSCCSAKASCDVKKDEAQGSSLTEKLAYAIKQVIVHEKKTKPKEVDEGENVDTEELDLEKLEFACSKALPPNYNFEIVKTVKRLRKASVKHLGLQLPEGLLMFASTLADILQQFAPSVE